MAALDRARRGPPEQLHNQPADPLRALGKSAEGVRNQLAGLAAIASFEKAHAPQDEGAHDQLTDLPRIPQSARVAGWR
jgi:hypothetical protein